MSMKLCTIFYLFAITLVCSKFSGTSAAPNYVALQAALDEAKSTWEAENIASYDMTIRRVCFCLVESLGPFTLSVQGDEIVAVSPDNQFSEGFPTVQGLFDLIQGAINNRVDALTAEYDATLGYPTDVSIDRSVQIADEEIAYTVSVANVVTEPSEPPSEGQEFNLIKHVRNLSQWVRAKPSQYTYKLTRLCFCAPDFVGPFIITVKNRRVIAAEFEDSDRGAVPPNTLNDLPTINDLFRIITREARQAYSTQISYDSVLKYPTMAAIDRKQNSIDDEITYIAELQ